MEISLLFAKGGIAIRVLFACTVLGIMRAFFQAAGSGIAEALIAAPYGLLVAISPVILYNLFKALRDQVMKDLELLQFETELNFGGKRDYGAYPRALPIF